MSRKRRTRGFISAQHTERRETYCVITLKDPLTKATAECVSVEITQMKTSEKRKIVPRSEGKSEQEEGEEK